MSYHPAVALFDHVKTHGELFADVQRSYGTLDAYYGTGTFSMDAAKALLASNAKSAARHMVAHTPTSRNIDDVRRTFRSRDVQDACASMLLYEYVKGKRDEQH